MNFKSPAKWFTATLVRGVFLENFLCERASNPRSGDIAGNELRSAEERKGFFFLSPHSFGTAICSFPGIGASNTNFHLVNQLVRYVPIFIVDTNVQQQPICLLSHGEKFFASAEQNDVVIRMDRCVQAVGEIHSRPLSL